MKKCCQHIKAACCILLSLVLFWGSAFSVYAEESDNIEIHQEDSMQDMEYSEKNRPDNKIQSANENGVENEKQTEENTESESWENTINDKRDQSGKVQTDADIKKDSFPDIETNTILQAKQDLRSGFTGLMKQSDGVWRYLINETVQSTYTGLVKHSTGTWYYVENGVVQFDVTGLVKHASGSWYYVKNGKMQGGYMGFVKHITGTWYYIEKGKMQSSYTGLAKHSTGSWYYTVKGKMQGSYTGLAKHVTGKWYYVENGKWLKSFSGLVKYNGKFYTVKQGLKAGNGKTAGRLSTNELRSASQNIAKNIANEAKKYSSDKWDQAAYAASRVYSYCSNSRYTTRGSNYSQPWGPFVIGEYSCAGSTRALGLVLDYLGISWSHTNPNQWTHQWCTVRINGEKGWADGMIGLSGTGEYPFI